MRASLVRTPQVRPDQGIHANPFSRADQGADSVGGIQPLPSCAGHTTLIDDPSAQVQEANGRVTIAINQRNRLIR
jgi:hypothetical protein